MKVERDSKERGWMTFVKTELRNCGDYLLSYLLSTEAEAGEAGGRLKNRTWSWR